MKTDSRKFITTALAGSALAVLPFSSRVTGGNSAIADKYEALDKILKLPVFKKQLFPEPVIIETLELLQDRYNFICRVRSKDGAEGISIGHPFISKNSYPMYFISGE